MGITLADRDLADRDATVGPRVAPRLERAVVANADEVRVPDALVEPADRLDGVSGGLERGSRRRGNRCLREKGSLTSAELHAADEPPRRGNRRAGVHAEV